MTKETSSGCSLLGIFHRYPRLMQGVSLIGGLGILSSGFVVAQTDSPIDTGIAPAKTAPERPIKTAPAPAPEPAARPRPTAPEPIAAPEASAYKPAREPAPYASTKPYVPTSESGSYSSKKPVGPISEPAPYAAKKPVAPVRARVESAPVANFVEKKPALASPNLSLPDSETVAQPPKVILKPAQIQENAKTPFEPANNFIDRTDYSIGATPRYEGPTSVVLSERSTGCQTVSQNGQLSSGVCGVAASSQQTANQPIANQPIGNQKVGNQPIGSQQTAISKLTLQEPLLTGVLRLPKPPVAAVQPSNPGFLKLADSGSRPTRQIPYSEYSAAPIPSRSSQSYYSAAPSTSSRGLDYYNLSTRPVGRPNIGKTSFMFPLAIPAAITSLFGWRVHPISGDYRFHAGTDLGAPEGTPVIAAVSGQVVNANFLGGYGLTVVLQHEKGTQQSLYGHLSEIFVQPGQQVEQGNVIGRVGSTGNSTGPHLHFEWRHLTSDGWVAVDAGAHLEYSLAQFIRALQIAQSSPQRGT